MTLTVAEMMEIQADADSNDDYYEIETPDEKARIADEDMDEPLIHISENSASKDTQPEDTKDQKAEAYVGSEVLQPEVLMSFDGKEPERGKDLEEELLTARAELEKINSEAVSLRSENEMLRIILGSIEKNQTEIVPGAPSGGICDIPKLELGSIVDESLSKQKLPPGIKKTDFPDDATECDFEEYDIFEEATTGHGTPERGISRRQSIHKLSISERTTAKATIYYLQSHLKTKEDDMKKMQNQIQEMDDEAEFLRDQVQQLVKKNKDMQADYLDTMHENFQGQIAELTDENKILKEQLVNLEIERNSQSERDIEDMFVEGNASPKMATSLIKKLWSSIQNKDMDCQNIVQTFQADYDAIFQENETDETITSITPKPEENASLPVTPRKMEEGLTDDDIDGSVLGHEEDTVKSEMTVSLLNHENAALLQRTKSQENEIMALRLRVENLEKDKEALSQNTGLQITPDEKESIDRELSALRGQVALLERNNKVFSNEERKELKQELDRTKRRVSSLNEQLMVIRESTEYEEVEKLKQQLKVQTKKIKELEIEKEHYREMCDRDMAEMLEEKEEIIKDRDVFIDELQHRVTSLTIRHGEEMEKRESQNDDKIKQLKAEMEDLRDLLKSKNKLVKEKQLELIKIQHLTRVPRINVSDKTDDSKDKAADTAHSSAPTSPRGRKLPPSRYRTSSLSRMGRHSRLRSTLRSRSHHQIDQDSSSSCSDSDARALKAVSSRMREDIEEAKKKLRDMGLALDTPQHPPIIQIPNKEKIELKYSGTGSTDLTVPKISIPADQRRNNIRSYSARSFRSREDGGKIIDDEWHVHSSRRAKKTVQETGEKIIAEETQSSDSVDGPVHEELVVPKTIEIPEEFSQKPKPVEPIKAEKGSQTTLIQAFAESKEEKEEKIANKKETSQETGEDISRVSVVDLLGKYAMLQVRSLDHEILQVENECMRKDFLRCQETVKLCVMNNDQNTENGTKKDQSAVSVRAVHDAFRYISTNFSSLLDKKHQAEYEIKKLKSEISKLQSTPDALTLVKINEPSLLKDDVIEQKMPESQNMKPRNGIRFDKEKNEFLTSAEPVATPKLLDYLAPAELAGHPEINKLRSCTYRIYVAKGDFTPNSSQTSISSTEKSSRHIFPNLTLKSGDIVISIGAPEKREGEMMFQLAEVRGRIGFVPLSHLQSAEQVHELKDFLNPQAMPRNMLTSHSPARITSMYDKLARKNAATKREMASRTKPKITPNKIVSSEKEDRIAEIFMKPSNRKRKVLSPKLPSGHVQAQKPLISEQRGEKKSTGLRKERKVSKPNESDTQKSGVKSAERKKASPELVDKNRHNSRKDRRTPKESEKRGGKRSSRSSDHSEVSALSHSATDSGIMHTKTDEDSSLHRGSQYSGESHFINDAIYSAMPDPPTNLKVEKVYGRRNLILRWSPPEMDAAGRSNGTPVIGYDVRTGRKAKIQITGAYCNKAVVGELDLRQPCNITIQTVSASGICSEPASFYYATV